MSNETQPKEIDFKDIILWIMYHGDTQADSIEKIHILTEMFIQQRKKKDQEPIVIPEWTK